MMGRLRWSRVTLALALIAALAIVAPALGGPSLKQLVKKEVAKQIGKATGPQGPQGNQGIPGVPGGASTAVASGPGDPPATADRSLAEVAITLPQPAKLYVTGSSTTSVTCNASGVCSSRIGLYVDSSANPIANSEYDADSTANNTVTRDASVVGVTGTLPAGLHVLKMYSTDVGNVASISNANSNIGVISLTG